MRFLNLKNVKYVFSSIGHHSVYRLLTWSRPLTTGLFLKESYTNCKSIVVWWLTVTRRHVRCFLTAVRTQLYPFSC